MKIALITLGTRGDVQPFAVLGNQLARQGHEVTLVTAKNFASLAKQFGLNFQPVDADYQKIATSPEGEKLLKANPWVIGKNINKLVIPLIEEFLDVSYKLARQSDKVIFRPKTLADGFADQLAGKIIRASVVPAAQPTHAFPNPMLSGFWIPPVFNKLSYNFYKIPPKTLIPIIREFRKKNHFPAKYREVPSPYLHGISPHFLPQPSDWPDNHIFTGFWYSQAMTKIPEKVEQFLNQGPPPLLITFGSTPFYSKYTIEKLVMTILKEFGTRVILVKGWDTMQTSPIQQYSEVCIAASLPYKLVLPRVKAVIHHGGIGTIAECLRAGKPMLTCPVLYPVGDQNFWGLQAYKLGAGIKPLPVKKMTYKKFSARVEQLLNNQAIYDNAQALQQKISKENGLENAVKWVEM